MADTRTHAQTYLAFPRASSRWLGSAGGLRWRRLAGRSGCCCRRVFRLARLSHSGAIELSASHFQTLERSLCSCSGRTGLDWARDQHLLSCKAAANFNKHKTLDSQVMAAQLTRADKRHTSTDLLYLCSARATRPA